MLQQFFWMCSSADTNILKSSSKAEQTKYAGVGATIFFTAVMATIAESYALFTVFDNVYSSIFFGLIWGLLIFNLDSFIVSTIKKNDNKWKGIWQATPRIILAIIIAIVIAKPLELKIFEKEINQVLLEQKVHQCDQVLKTDMHINEEIYSDLTEEEELYNYKRKKARELLQQQADAFHQSQQKVIS